MNVSRLRNPRRDWALVGAAGPLSNLAIALLLAVLLSLLSHGGLAPSSSLTKVLAVGIFVNVLLAVFNLLPIPPLDGSRIVQYALSGEALRAYRQMERFGLLLILGLVFFVPPVQAFLVDAVVVCTDHHGAAGGMAGSGAGASDLPARLSEPGTRTLRRLVHSLFFSRRRFNADAIVAG